VRDFIGAPEEIRTPQQIGSAPPGKPAYARRFAGGGRSFLGCDALGRAAPAEFGTLNPLKSLNAPNTNFCLRT